MKKQMKKSQIWKLKRMSDQKALTKIVKKNSKIFFGFILNIFQKLSFCQFPLYRSQLQNNTVRNASRSVKRVEEETSSEHIRMSEEQGGLVGVGVQEQSAVAGRSDHQIAWQSALWADG